jgi:branched-chain amino acid transport system ATP-binding protein
MIETAGPPGKGGVMLERKIVPPLVDLRGVHAGYGAIEVLHGVDLAVPAGSVTALLGPNGAGKTTTLRTLAGLHPATAGDIFLAGRRVNGASADDLTRAGLCLIPEGRGVFPNLTVRENLRVATHTGRTLAEIESDVYERFPRLAGRRNQLAGTLSGGEQQMLALARGVACRPGVLLLDELSMGLAPTIVSSLYEEVARIAAEGVAILLVEQFARVALQVADWGTVLLGGRVVASGTPAELEGSLTELYMGGGS